VEDRVVYDGREMVASWPPRIEAAQLIHDYVIGGVRYARIRYGDEQDDWGTKHCHDCGVRQGKYHVQLICDAEEGPRCHGQVIGCDCPYEGDEGD
jgi:hypothetical protein